MFDLLGTTVPFMDKPAPARIACHQCRAAVDAGDSYCRHCGAATANLSGTRGSDDPSMPVGAKVAPAASARPPGFWERPGAVLTSLFLLLGPFALPLLWRSRRFTLRWKNILTALILGLTALLLCILWLAMQPLIRQLRELGEVLRP